MKWLLRNMKTFQRVFLTYVPSVCSRAAGHGAPWWCARSHRNKLTGTD